MVSLPVARSSEKHEHLRPLNALRDLPQVADLMELCFADTLDGDGQRYVEDMRRAGRDRFLGRWVRRAIETTSLPLNGFVWEENGKIVGNVSLVSFRYQRERIFLIANVATHPDYRRRGIARALTERAMEWARQRRASAIWLHVRENNPGAVALYQELGFAERARRTTWRSEGAVPAVSSTFPFRIEALSPGLLGYRAGVNWSEQQEWWRRVYPDELAWYRHWDFSVLQPGLRSWFHLWFVEMDARQWGAFRRESSLVGGNAWRRYWRGSHLGRGENRFGWRPLRGPGLRR